MSRPIFLLSLILLSACKKETMPEPAIQTVRAGVVDQILPEPAERYSATISPVETIDMAFKSAGLIDHVYKIRGADGRTRDVQAGDMVTKGTELAVVRTVDYEQRVQQAQMQVAQAEAQLEQAAANLREAETEYTRAKTLFESASLVKPQYDQAKGRYESAQATVKGAQAAIANARTVVDQTTLSLGDTSLRAPFTGWITARNVQEGSLVGNSTVGFSMMDTHLVKAIFAVPERQFEERSIRTAAERLARGPPASSRRRNHFDLSAGRSQRPRLPRRGHHRQSERRSATRHDRHVSSRRPERSYASPRRSPKRAGAFARAPGRLRRFQNSQSRWKSVRRCAGHSDRQHLWQFDRSNGGLNGWRAHRLAGRVAAP